MLRRLLFYGLLIALAISPCQYAFEWVRKTHLSPVDPLLWLIFAGWLFALWQRRDGTRPPRVPLLTALFLLAAAASVVRASDRLASLKDLFQFTEYFVVAYLLCVSLVQESAARRTALWVFLGVGSLVVVYGLTQYLKPAIPALSVRSTFGNRNVLGGYLSLLLPLALGLALGDTNAWRRVWLLALVVAGFVLNLSGGTFLALTIAFAWVAALHGLRPLVAAGACLVLVSLALLPHLPRPNTDILNASACLYEEGSADVTSRYREWQAAVTMTRENPVLGVGLGNYQANIGGYYGAVPSPAVPAEHDSQNLYLVLASSVGLPALACFVGLLLWSFRNASLAAARTADRLTRGLAAGVAGALAAYAVNALWSPLLVRGIGVPLAFLLALSAVVAGAGESGAARPPDAAQHRRA